MGGYTVRKIENDGFSPFPKTFSQAFHLSIIKTLDCLVVIGLSIKTLETMASIIEYNSQPANVQAFSQTLPKI